MAFSFLQNAQDATLFQSSYTFSSQNLGTAASDRQIIVLAKTEGVNGGGLVFSSITVQGITATLIQADTGAVTANNCAIAIVDVPTGTTGDIVVTLGVTTAYDMGIGVYRATNTNLTAFHSASHSPAAGTSPTASVSINVPSTGFVIGVAGSRNDASISDMVWSGITTRDYFVAARSNAMHSGARGTPAEQSGLTVSCAYTSSGSVAANMLVASFQDIAAPVIYIPDLRLAFL